MLLLVRCTSVSPHVHSSLGVKAGVRVEAAFEIQQIAMEHSNSIPQRTINNIKMEFTVEFGSSNFEH